MESVWSPKENYHYFNKHVLIFQDKPRSILIILDFHFVGQNNFTSSTYANLDNYPAPYPSAFKSHISPYPKESDFGYPLLDSQFGSSDFYNPNYTSLSQPTYMNPTVPSQGGSAFNVVPSNSSFSSTVPFSNSGKRMYITLYHVLPL